MDRELGGVRNKKIKLLCLDGSKQSEEALDWFFKNVYQEGEEIGLIHIHVLPSIPTFGVYTRNVVVSDVYGEAIQKSIDESKAVLKKYKDVCAEKGIPVRTFVETCQKSVGNTICKIAQQHGSLLIMGQRGLGKMRRTLFGSVSSYVLHNAGIPVTIIPSYITDS